MAELYNSRIDLKEIVYVRSPQYLSLEHFPDGVVAKANSITLEIYVWDGDKASVPVTPTYTLSQKASDISGDNTYALFEVSSFISEFITPSFVNANFLNNTAVWFKLKAIADTSVLYYDSGTHLATLGFGSYSSGANPGVQNAVDLSDELIGMPNNFKLSPNNINRFSLYIGENSNVVSFEKIGDAIDIIAIGSTLSDRQFFVVNAPVNSCEKGKYRVTYNTNQTRDYNFEAYDVKGQGKEIVYVGQYGVNTSIQFMGRVDITETVKRDTYSNVIVNRISIYDSSEHQKKVFNTQATSRIKISTGLLHADQVSQLKDLMVSEYIWMIENNIAIPLVLIDTNFAEKNVVYDKLHDYTFTFEIAVPQINQVV